jgi:hypothetical protein
MPVFCVRWHAQGRVVASEAAPETGAVRQSNCAGGVVELHTTQVFPNCSAFIPRLRVHALPTAAAAAAVSTGAASSGR